MGEFASNALAIKRNCVDHHGATTSSKKSIVKSSTVSEMFDAVDSSSSNETKIESSPIDVCQMNNNHQLPCYIKSKFSRDNTDENRPYNTSNNTMYPHTNIIYPSGEMQSQHGKSMNRQQSCQEFLTHSSQFSKHIKRQNSLVAFATDYENDMNEKGCRWEF